MTPKVRTIAFVLLTVLMGTLSGCSTGTTERSDAKPVAGAGSSSASVRGNVGATVKTAYGSYTNLEPAELRPMLESKDFFLVDVHTPPAGRLPKTDARIPYDQVEEQIGKFPSEKSAKIVLTCRSGRMSSEASQTLLRLGYTNVYNLNGGMNAWKASGYEIIPEGK